MAASIHRLQPRCRGARVFDTVQSAVPSVLEPPQGQPLCGDRARGMSLPSSPWPSWAGR